MSHHVNFELKILKRNRCLGCKHLSKDLTGTFKATIKSLNVLQNTKWPFFKKRKKEKKRNKDVEEHLVQTSVTEFTSDLFKGSIIRNVLKKKKQNWQDEHTSVHSRYCFLISHTNLYADNGFQDLKKRKKKKRALRQMCVTSRASLKWSNGPLPQPHSFHQCRIGFVQCTRLLHCKRLCFPVSVRSSISTSVRTDD